MLNKQEAKNLADKIQTTKKTIGKNLPEKTNPT